MDNEVKDLLKRVVELLEAKEKPAETTPEMPWFYPTSQGVGFSIDAQLGDGMMTRYYYDCPIMAGYMAKYFGMKMLYERDGQSLSNPLPLWQFARRIEFGDGKEIYVVHPDSLPLLDPQVGDIVMVNADGIIIPERVSFWHDDGDESYPYTGNGQRVYLLESMRPSWFYAEQMTIIHRDGKAFHWPMKEEK